MAEKNSTGKGAWLFAVVTLACTAAFFAAAFKAPQTSDQMAYLPDTPEVKRFLEINRRYGNFNTVLLGVETENILAPANIKKLKDLTDAIGKLAGVSWMSAITTVPEMRASEEGVNVAPLISEIPKDDAAVAALKARILKTRQIVGDLVSPDFTSALVPITMYGDKVAEVYPRIETLARAAAGPGFKVYFHGAPAIDEYLAKGGKALVIPGIVAGIVFLFFLIIGVRPGRIPAWLLVVAPSAAAGMAAPVLLKMQASELSMASGLVAFVYGTMVVFSYPGADDEKRFRKWRRNLLVASASLVAVLLSLALSAVVPLRGLGVAAAVACIVCALVAPLAMRMGRGLPAGPPARDQTLRSSKMGIYFVLFVVVAAGFFYVKFGRLSATNDIASTFGKNSEPAKAVDFLDRRFGGSEYLTIVATGDLNHPGFLRAIDDLAVAIRGVPGVESAVSPTDVFKMVSEAMIGRYRIPDTINQMQALWFFLEGQPELSALVYQKEQGLVQIRLSPDGARRSAEVVETIKKLTAAVPSRIGHVDLRKIPEVDAARLRERQLSAALKAMSSILGPKSEKHVQEVLRSISRMGSDAEQMQPKTSAANNYRTSLVTGLVNRFAEYFESPTSVVTLDRFEAFFIAVAFAREAGIVSFGGEGIDGIDLGFSALRAPSLLLPRGRDGVENYLRDKHQVDEATAAKTADVLAEMAHEVQDKVLLSLVRDTLTRAGHAEAGVHGMTPELAAAIRDFTSPHVFVDAARDGAKTESTTETKFELSGYPVIAHVVERETHADFARVGASLAAVLALAAIIGLALGGKGSLRSFSVVVAAIAGALSWLVFGLSKTDWTVNVSSFIPLAVILAGCAAAWVVVASTKNRLVALALGSVIPIVTLMTLPAALAMIDLFGGRLQGAIVPVMITMIHSVAGLGGMMMATAFWSGRVPATETQTKEEGK